MYGIILTRTNPECQHMGVYFTILSIILYALNVFMIKCKNNSSPATITVGQITGSFADITLLTITKELLWTSLCALHISN
jgi:hypothetical protein